MLGSRPAPITIPSVVTQIDTIPDLELSARLEASHAYVSADENDVVITMDADQADEATSKDYRNLIVNDIFNLIGENNLSDEVYDILSAWSNAPEENAIEDMHACYEMSLQDDFAERARQLRAMEADRDSLISQMHILQQHANFASMLESQSLLNLAANARIEDANFSLKMMDHIFARSSRIQQYISQQMLQTQALFQTQNQQVMQWRSGIEGLARMCDLQSYLHLVFARHGLQIVDADLVNDAGLTDDAEQTVDAASDNEVDEVVELEAESNHEASDEEEQDAEVEAESDHEASDEEEQDAEADEEVAAITDQHEADGYIGLRAMEDEWPRSAAPGPLAVTSPRASSVANNIQSFWRTKAEHRAAAELNVSSPLMITPRNSPMRA